MSEPSLTPSRGRRLDAVCDRFEAAWRTGPRPSLEEYLTQLPEADRAAAFPLLLGLDRDYRVAAREAPQPADYLARFPGRADAVAAVFAEPSRPPVTTPEAPSSRPAEPGQVVGDYELLEEIAQGGMGVVYRARQVSLNRVVALKMIRSGALATADDVRRFQREAEAAAGLDHENIVPVYEVGSHDGQPYFSMRLVEGPSLARVVAEEGPAVTRPAQRRAAGLVATLAGAVHFAHQRGILHRDLKPHNVLLDPSGKPQLTDFGLAKRLPLDGVGTAESLSQAGAIVGTAGYMSPEQARGHSREVTTASDLYGLGAILFELLTGRIPFKGATPFDTLLEVMSSDPPRPRALNRALDRDLETICLKCLEKEAGRRYASAAALAEDLGRWLAGEPIEARPVGPLGRAWRWGRRNPAVAASLGAVTASLLLGALVATAFGLQAREEAENARKSEGKAQDEKRDAEAARDKFADSVARGWLRPLAYGKKLPPEEMPSLSDMEVAALDELASSDDGMRMRFLREGLKGPLATRRLRDRADHVFHAAVGLDAGRRDRAERLLADRLGAEGVTEQERIDVALALGTLGAWDEETRRQAAAALVEAMGRTADEITLWKLSEGLAALAGRMGEKEAAAVCGSAATSLVGAMGRTTHSEAWKRLSEGLAALAGRMSAAEAAAAAHAVVGAMGRTTDEGALRSLSEGLAALAGRMGEKEAAAVCGSAATAVVEAMGRTGDTYVWMGLLEGLGALAGRMGEKEAAATVTAVVREMGRTGGTHAKRLLSKGLAALAGRMGKKEAAAAATAVVGAMESKSLTALLRRESSATTNARFSAVVGTVCGLGMSGSPFTAPVLLTLALSPLPPPRKTRSRLRWTATALLTPALSPLPPPLPAQTLVDLLKHPLCVAEARRVVLGELSRHYGRPFADQWEFVEFATRQELGLDLTTPTPRPDRR